MSNYFKENGAPFGAKGVGPATFVITIGTMVVFTCMHFHTPDDILVLGSSVIAFLLYL